MQLARFEGFALSLGENTTVDSALISKIYRFHNDKWYCIENKIIDDKQLLKTLSTIRKNKKNYWRPSSSKTAYIYLAEMDCVIFANYVSPPREATQKKTYSKLSDLCENSKNAFDASHNLLTGLYNKSALHKMIIEAMQDILSVNSGGQQEVVIPPSVGVIALDIDHFKQVNDSFGHMYGDLVLQCFARRIDLCCKSIEANSGGKLTIFSAHPSGEEFNVVLKGIFSKEEILMVGEKIRLCIFDEPLPSDEECALMLGKDPLGEISLPNLSDRTVSASIGITYSCISLSGDFNVLARSMLNCADIALYRAKNGGRNTVRFFEDILQLHGTILEHHNETNIVSIDIGRQVNVVPGQEFLVFHPDFSGKTPFYFTDGRTKKRMGYYPRYSCGRIEAFDVQEEISFCRVLERDNEIKFPTGSLLESVPIGSISHLIMKDIKGSYLYKQNSLARENLHKALENLINKKVEPITAVFSLLNTTTVIKDRGGAFVNSSLAELFETVRSHFPITAILGQPQSTQIAVIAPASEDFDHRTVIQNVLDIMNGKYSGVITFVAGAYSLDEAKKVVITGDSTSYLPKYALSYASYAISEWVVNQSSIFEYFSVNTALKILNGWFEKIDLKQALADYNEFTKMGIKYSLVENKISNLAYTAKEYDVALKHSHSASVLSPNDIVLLANIAIMNFALGNKVKACDEFSTALQKTGAELPKGYLLTYGMSMYEKYKKYPDEVDKSIIVKTLSEGVLVDAKINLLKMSNADVASIIAEIEGE